jgi:hypothetical protein
MKLLMVIFVGIGISVINALGMDIQIEVKKASINGEVKIEVQNHMDHLVRLWEIGGNSWGWSNWTIEFFSENNLVIYVRKPDEGFTRNVPAYIEISGKGNKEFKFDLNDGTWVSHRIPIWPAYPSKEDREKAISGCFVVLSIPKSTESEKLSVWTGMMISLPMQGGEKGTGNFKDSK